MRGFAHYNPIAVTVYYLTVTGAVMLCMDPVLLLLSLAGAILLFFSVGGRGGASHGGALLLFLALTLINPLVSHNGVTVLFVLNDAPITLEALVYGAVAAGTVITVLYWFRSFMRIMTSDRLLYLFGRLSPRLALILSMGLRYVPLFRRQSGRIRAAQTALGLYGEDNLADRLRGGTRVFSVMVTWALENGIVTADSMTARGYGTGKRSHFSVFRFRRGDGLLLLVTLGLGGLVAVCFWMGAFDVRFYPSIDLSLDPPWSFVGYGAYGLLALLPTLMEWKERIKWSFLRWRI